MTSYVFFVCFFNHCFLQKFLYLYNNVWRHLWTTLNDLLDKEDGECLKINGSNTKLLIVSALIGPDCVAALGGPLYSNGLLRQFSQMMRIHFPTYSLKHFATFSHKILVVKFQQPFWAKPNCVGAGSTFGAKDVIQFYQQDYALLYKSTELKVTLNL